MDTLEISLRTEQGICTETYNSQQNFLGHSTFSVKKRIFSFVLQQFLSSSNKMPLKPHAPSYVVWLKVFFRRNQQATLIGVVRVGKGC